MSSLGARLVALSGEVEENPKREGWLDQQMEEFKLREGITEATVPTKDLIKRQVLLPQFGTSQDLEDFKDPIRFGWNDVIGEQKLPGWNKENLPDEEILQEELVVVDRKELMSTGKYLLQGASVSIPKEEILNNNGVIKIPKKEEVLNDPELDDRIEIAVLDSSCVIRTTKRALRGGGGDRDAYGRGGDRGGHHERAPGAGGYGGRDRSRSPRYRQRSEQGDRSHGGRQERSYDRRDYRASYGQQDSRDYRGNSRGDSRGERSYGRCDREEAGGRRGRESSRESYRGREEKSNYSRQERGDQRPRQIKQEVDFSRAGARAPRQDGPSGQVEVKQEPREPRTYEEWKKMKNKKKE